MLFLGSDQIIKRYAFLLQMSALRVLLILAVAVCAVNALCNVNAMGDWEQGDGKSRREERIGNINYMADCGSNVQKERPDANGATFGW